MTAEIVVMNRLAIALAADSAVTITQPGGEQKIYNTVNKLFALSKHQPVGVMVYGRADFMGIPWETIIKTYRGRLGNARFDHLQEYADDFLSFFSGKTSLFPEEQQINFAQGRIILSFLLIRDAIKQAVDARVKEAGEVTETQIQELVAEKIADRLNRLGKASNLPTLAESFEEEFLTQHSETVKKTISTVFQKLPVSEEAVARLLKIAVNVIKKDEFDENYSGLVIAGFGEKEIFPKLRSYNLDGVINNQLRYQPQRTVDITFDMGAYIGPFGQSDMVHTFMDGVDPYYHRLTSRAMRLLLERYTNAVVEKLEKYGGNEREALLKSLQPVKDEHYKTIRELLDRHREENCTDKIIRAVGALPKDELAAMAEALVNLTVFKRKVSFTAETVGGPVDVAVVTKGDGLIWIKRKHYFAPELNAQFFANYYRKDESGGS